MERFLPKMVKILQIIIRFRELVLCLLELADLRKQLFEAERALERIHEESERLKRQILEKERLLEEKFGINSSK